MLVAVSVDGKISPRRVRGQPNPVGPELISDEIMALHNSMRAGVEGIMVGLNCILLDDSRLTLRGSGGKNPTRIVLDGLAEMSPEARVLDDQADTIVAVTEDAPAEKVKAFKKKGAEIIVSGRGRFVTLPTLMEKLYTDHGMTKIVVEGGGTLHRSMIAEGLYNELHLIICPFVIGGSRSITPAGRSPFWPKGVVPRYRLVKNETLGDYVYVVYEPGNEG